MKIIIINDYASVQGGAAQVAVTSARGLADTGHKVTFVYGTGDVDPLLEHDNIQLIDLGQYDLLSNPSRFNAITTGIWNRAVEKQLHELFALFDNKETIVHIHSWVKALSASAVSVIVEREFPIVMTLHDYFTVCPNGGLYNYQKESICQLEPMSLSCLASNCDVRNYSQKLWRYLRQKFYAKAGIPNRLRHFIFVSKFSKEILRPHLPKDAKFWDVPNPITVPKEEMADPSHANTFSYIGRLSHEKGVISFADASHRLGVAARFVGSGNLDSKIKEYNPNAIFTGWSQRADVIHYIKDSRAVIFPSLWYETQGLVVTEAAALGIPSIVSDTCAARDNIIDGETGLLFESGNTKDMMQKIQRLSEDADLAKEMGEKAYQHYWKDPHDITRHATDLITCYKAILTEEQSKRENR